MDKDNEIVEIIRVDDDTQGYELDLADCPEDARKRTYFVQRNYVYETRDNPMSEDDWLKNIIIPELLSADGCKLRGIRKVYLIVHNKDNLSAETDDKKPTHIHAVVYFYDNITASRAMQRCGCSCLQNCRPLKRPKDINKALRYLVHYTEAAREELKHIYDSDAVMTYFAEDEQPVSYLKAIKLSTYQKRKDEAINKADVENAMSDLMLSVETGHRTAEDIKAIYRDDTLCCGLNLWQYNKHRSAYERAEADYYKRVYDYYTTAGNHRCLTTVIISGFGGSRKSELAELVCNTVYPGDIYKTAVRGQRTTFDFAGNYKGQRTTIINEFSDGFALDQFLDVFDPIHAPLVNSRNSDKPWFSELCVIATSKTVTQIVSMLLTIDSRNPNYFSKLWELSRRLPVYVKLQGDVANIYICDYLAQRRNIPTSDTDFICGGYYKHYGAVSHNGDFNILTDRIREAIAFYYDYNKHTVTPDNTRRPTFDKFYQPEKITMTTTAGAVSQ